MRYKEENGVFRPEIKTQKAKKNILDKLPPEVAEQVLKQRKLTKKQYRDE